MSDKYAELRAALAAGPTPGPWLLDKFHPHITDAARGSSQVLVCQVATNTRNDEGRKNEAYIAAANPETIRALLAERDALASEVETLRSHNALLRASIAQVEAENDRLREALEARINGQAQDAADAARYRWLRINAIGAFRTNDGKGPVSVYHLSKIPAIAGIPEETDIAIDAAMEAKP
jgi:hypothetical protein